MIVTADMMNAAHGAIVIGIPEALQAYAGTDEAKTNKFGDLRSSRIYT